MKIISISQPMASLIAYGVVDILNVKKAIDYRGPILIHAKGSGGYDTRRIDDPRLPIYKEINNLYIAATHKFRPGAKYYKAGPDLAIVHKKGKVFSKSEMKEEDFLVDHEEPLLQGAIVGGVFIENAIDDGSEWADKDMIHLVLTKPVEFATPISGVKSKPSIWDVPDDTLNREVLKWIKDTKSAYASDSSTAKAAVPAARRQGAGRQAASGQGAGSKRRKSKAGK